MYSISRIVRSLDLDLESFKISMIVLNCICFYGVVYFIYILSYRYVFIRDDHIFLVFGTVSFFKKIYFRDIKHIRYKQADEPFRKKVPDYGEYWETVVLEIQKEGKKKIEYQISVENVGSFYNTIKEAIHQVDEDDEKESVM